MLNINKNLKFNLLKKNQLRNKNLRNHKINLKEFHKKYNNFLKLKHNFIKNKFLKKIELFEINRFSSFEDREIMFFFKNRFYKKKITRALKIKNSIYLKYLKKFSKDTECLIEFGCGYGNNIIEIIKNKSLKNKPIIGLDASKTGISFLNYLLKKKKLSHRVTTGRIDIYNNKLKKNLPLNSLIFTSFVMHYKKKFKTSSMNIFFKCRPRFVVHFEPIYEHFKNNKIDQIRKKYIENNNYTLNFLQILKKLEKKKKLKILLNKPKLFGMNILLPFSLIVWKPIYR